ncbi:MAG: queuosine precursor transporter [Bacilli bacterium]|nr:queuosine precursor transporter [Bacilli bacterium]
MKRNEKKENIRKEKYSLYFVLITVMSTVLLLISNTTSIKLFSIGKIVLPTSALLFPITYIIGDIIAEVYGYKKARFVILLGFSCNAFMALFYVLTIKLPAAATWNLQNEYASILGTTPRMFIASLSAMLIGSLSNAFTLDLIKKLTKGKHLWMRTIGSTIVGELLDTLLFATIAFIGTVPTSVVLTMIVSQYTWKVTYEAIATPLTYKIINAYKKLENN